jgi:PHP family Zn ribbon phosphoesterase
MPKKETPNTEPAAEEPQTPLDEFLQHQRRALEESGKAIEALLPEGFREHGSEASREFAKGLKVLVDAAINELEKVSKKVEEEAEEKRASTTGKTKVKVQVE